MSEPRLVSFKTVGCRLNQAETAQISAHFKTCGYKTVEFGEKCDVCVIHTCAITSNAERRSLQHARAARRLNSNTFVVLAGCFVEVDDGTLLQRSGADMIVGQKDKYILPSLIKEALSDISHDEEPEGPQTLPPEFSTTRAIVKVQDGCGFMCAYCIVPYTRGKPVSRPEKEIITELEQIAQNGYREVVITGANLGCYSDGKRTLIDLLKEVEKIDGIERIRLSSIEFSGTERTLIDYMANSKKICRFLHLPLQSGDDTILKKMGRRYTSKEYCDLIDYAMNVMPHIGLGADVIVGFPGETEAAFNNTIRIIENIPLSNLHVFSYSPRPGTKAYELANDVPKAEKKRRSSLLTDVGNSKRNEFAQSFVSKPVSVLIERVLKGNMGKGWTSEYIEALIEADNITENQIIEFLPAKCANNVLIS